MFAETLLIFRLLTALPEGTREASKFDFILHRRREAPEKLFSFRDICKQIGKVCAIVRGICYKTFAVSENSV